MSTEVVIRFSFICLLLVFLGCGNGKHSTHTGLEYKFIEDVDGDHARPGDVITLDMVYKTDADSLLFSSRMISDSFRLILKKPSFYGGMEEGLALMSVGDSIEFWVNADSLYQKTFYNTKPAIVSAGSKVKFYGRLKKIAPLEEYEKELADVRAKNYAIEQHQIDNYVKQNNITVPPLEDGVYFIETKKGNGKRALYDTHIGVRYIGKLLSGKVIDGNLEKKKLFYFHVGHDEVISGWEEAVQRMAAGGKATVIIPSRYAYGERGSGPVPPYSPLVFDIEVVEVK